MNRREMGVREHLEWEGGAGSGGEGWPCAGSQHHPPPPPVLMEPCVAAWAGEEGAELEEEVDEEEEEESGNLDEEGIKKMQSDEVRGKPRVPPAGSTGEPSRWGWGLGSWARYWSLLHTAVLIPRAQRAWK